MPLEGALLLDRGWITEEMVATYIDCGGCKGRGVQTYENQEQGFLLKRQVKNMWCDLCQKAWNWRNGEARKGEITRVQCIECERKDTIGGRVLEQEKRKILCLECRIGGKKTIVELESGGVPHRRKSTAEQHMGRDSKKHSKEEG